MPGLTGVVGASSPSCARTTPATKDEFSGILTAIMPGASIGRKLRRLVVRGGMSVVGESSPFVPVDGGKRLALLGAAAGGGIVSLLSCMRGGVVKLGEGEPLRADMLSSMPVVESRRLICGVSLTRSSPSRGTLPPVTPPDVCGLTMRGATLGGFGDPEGDVDGGEGVSGLILPIDIFLRNPQRLLFSLEGRWPRALPLS